MKLMILLFISLLLATGVEADKVEGTPTTPTLDPDDLERIGYVLQCTKCKNKFKKCEKKFKECTTASCPSPSPSPPPAPSPPPSPSPPPPYNKFTSWNSLRKALQAYDANPASAEEKYGPIAGWDVSAITDMSLLFYRLENFNEWRISNWDTSRVTRMSGMFDDASSLSAANKLLIRCAWADTEAFASARYDESWAPGSC